jgi:hypothetical protein
MWISSLGGIQDRTAAQVFGVVRLIPADAAHAEDVTGRQRWRTATPRSGGLAWALRSGSGHDGDAAAAFSRLSKLSCGWR